MKCGIVQLLRLSGLALVLGLPSIAIGQVFGQPRLSDPPLPPPGATVQVQAVPVGPQTPIFGPGNDAPLVQPNHPPIETVPYMPICEPGPTVPPSPTR
jgi:hypothetical protein